MRLSEDLGIEMSYELDGQGLIPGRGKRFFSTTQRPDWLWGSPNLLSNGYQELFFPGSKAAGS
jgi:hypothetical protein